MLTDALTNAGVVAKVTMFMGLLPLAMGVAYAVWPSEQRLALLRPLSLATIFAALSGSVLGVVHVFRGIGVSGAPGLSPMAALGLAEALVPTFVGLGCLTVAWLCVTIGLWRRP
jgi:hypothetical protein